MWYFPGGNSRRLLYLWQTWSRRTWTYLQGPRSFWLSATYSRSQFVLRWHRVSGLHTSHAEHTIFLTTVNLLLKIAEKETAENEFGSELSQTCTNFVYSSFMNKAYVPVTRGFILEHLVIHNLWVAMQYHVEMLTMLDYFEPSSLTHSCGR